MAAASAGTASRQLPPLLLLMAAVVAEALYGGCLRSWAVACIPDCRDANRQPCMFRIIGSHLLCTLVLPNLRAGNATCTKPKVGVVWKGTPYLVLANVKTYDRCCRGEAQQLSRARDG